MIPIVQLTCTAFDPDGRPSAGDIFRATLDKTDIYPGHGFVVAAMVEVIADASGIVTFNLWPNELGTEGSSYRIEAFNPQQRKKYVDMLVVVPNRACSLHELAATAINLIGK